MHIIYFDGSCRGNGTDEAVGGAAWVDKSANLAFSRMCGHERNTNNRAEYDGLRGAMQHAADFGYTHVTFRGDSQLIIEQMKGTWKAKDEYLRMLRDDLLAFADQHFEEVRYEWVPREKNPADELAAKATGRR